MAAMSMVDVLDMSIVVEVRSLIELLLLLLCLGCMRCGAGSFFRRG